MKRGIAIAFLALITIAANVATLAYILSGVLDNANFGH